MLNDKQLHVFTGRHATQQRELPGLRLTGRHPICTYKCRDYNTVYDIYDRLTSLRMHHRCVQHNHVQSLLVRFLSHRDYLARAEVELCVAIVKVVRVKRARCRGGRFGVTLPTMSILWICARSGHGIPWLDRGVARGCGWIVVRALGWCGLFGEIPMPR